LNIGCGGAFHKDWTNLDFVSTGEDVIAYNLLKGIPFPDNSFDVVYHSHILEHFSRNDGKELMEECYRVLKVNGTLRIAVPDLKRIVDEYIRLFTAVKENGHDPYLGASYDWIIIELYDQTVRNKGGGSMAEFLRKDNLVNEDFILKRCGYEVKSIIDSYRESKKDQRRPEKTTSGRKLPEINTIPNKLRTLRQKLIAVNKGIKKMFLKGLLGSEYQYYDLGKFRSSGEIHQWMYDEYSLARLLTKTNFKDIRVCTAFESRINQWQTFGLETIEGNVRKPDSLFMEAIK
jgi:ubiquinone/menaquinone biosynthesis C-methylase UbiE